jgi:superoxide dismutase
LVIGFTDHLQFVTTNNYNALTNPRIRLLTTAHTNSSQFVFASRFLVTDVLCLRPTLLVILTTDSQAGSYLKSTSCSSDCTESTTPHCCISIFALGKCLFAKPLLSNGSCIFAYLAIVVQQHAYMLKYNNLEIQASELR